ncbi:uncharacterized protein LOC113377575 [Ctenocephalides felis]|uniref:uncharacterized protein LOC113377575 n=1 Tax=Ctenocephalides felis TaxID=7515 RepID=UPI000E6E4975|nr:uncharacterized protein LOC113377575 [Ctenocephalides felis]
MTSFGSTQICASLLVLVVIVQQGKALSCYECNSHNDTRCSEDIPPENLKKNCDDHKGGTKYTMCRKITQVIEFEVNGLPPDTRVIRGCGWDESSYKGKCYQRSGFGGRQEVCSCLEDYCNGSSGLQASTITSLVCSMFALIAFRVR